MKRRTFIVFCFSFVTALVVGFYFIYSSDFFKLKNIHISYIPSFQTKEIYWTNHINVLRKQFDQMKGRHLWSINPYQIKRELSKKKWLQAFRLQRIWPDQLKILLKPKKIIALEVNHRATVFPLARDGSTLDASSLMIAPLAPIIRYSKQSFLKDTKIRKKLTYMLSHLPDQGDLSLQKVDEITIEENQIYLHLLKEQMKIQLGEKHIPVKIARVSKILKYLRSQDITGRVIDADFYQKVLVRPLKHR